MSSDTSVTGSGDVGGDRRAPRRGRRTVRAAASLVAALLIPAGLVGGQPAYAEPIPPVPPSAAQVQQAKGAAGTKAAQVRAVQAALVAASARLDSTRIAAAQATEAFDAARIRLAAAEQAAQLARSNADRAAGSYERARVEVGRLAAQVYRDGADLSELSAVLSPGGPQEVMDRAAVIDTLGAERTRTLQRMDATRVVATLLQQQADEAVTRQKVATAALSTAREKAQSAADAAAATVAATEAEQTRLLTQLAALQHTSVALERQRQAALAAAADAAVQPAAGGSGGSGSGGSGSGGSGGSGSGSGGSGGSGSDDSDGSGGSGSGGSGHPVPPPSGPSHGSTGGDVAVAWAKRQIGLPYQWGGAGPNSYDCSGLTMRAWQRAGIQLPHYAASQYEQSDKIPYSRMQPGDLIFYSSDTSRPSSIHHVAMYVGGGLMIEAPYTGARVRVVPVRWNRTMATAARP